MRKVSYYDMPDGSVVIVNGLPASVVDPKTGQAWTALPGKPPKGGVLRK